MNIRQTLSVISETIEDQYHHGEPFEIEYWGRAKIAIASLHPFVYDVIPRRKRPRLTGRFPVESLVWSQDSEGRISNPGFVLPTEVGRLAVTAPGAISVLNEAASMFKLDIPEIVKT